MTAPAEPTDPADPTDQLEPGEAGDVGQPSHQLLIEVTVAAPVDEVWAHLRDPELVARWFGWSYDGLADEIELIFRQGATATEPAAGTDDPHVLNWDAGPEHGDRIELHADGPGTRVRVTRPAPLGAQGWDGIFDDIAEGWISFVEQLRFALDLHRGADRRTVFVASPLGDGAPDGAAAALGVRGEVGDAVGGPLGPEGGWTGAIAFRHAHQVGVRIDQLGPGLLVVVDKPAEDDPPHGSAMATITTYGLEGADHAELDARWQAWWAAEVAAAPAEAPPS